MMTDPIADMLTRVRNALRIERGSVEMPCSKIKVAIAEALQREGYIWDFEVLEQEPQNVLRINLKYGPN
ncbi:MAG: 30S ribosomal protein S8, partial [Planctomycetaceae bacterium]|nr:30S ribosomal protein S8 [Planctomycetaceae bacterium]